LRIHDNSDSNTHSCSNLGNAYTTTHIGIENKSEEAYSYLAGANHFSVGEIEVY
jgi:hypothetical protein